MSSATLSLRIKSKKSQNMVMRGVSTSQTVEEFLTKLSEMTDVPATQIVLLKGFPPKRIEIDDRNRALESLGLSNQDTVIVEGDGGGTSNGLPSSSTAGTNNGSAITTTGNTTTSSTNASASKGRLMRQIVPADNSCLFTSIGFCINGKMDDSDPGAFQTRQLIAAVVASDPDRFNEAMLGRPNADYMQWIMKNESWGGGIELAILCDYYQIEMAVVDIQSLHISKFGEDKDYTQRMLLLYDGIHYDPLFFEPGNGQRIETLFPVWDSAMLDKAIQLGRDAKANHQFTDLTNFSLKCGICNTLLKGQTEAQAHAKTTGHMNFQEVHK